MPTGKRSNSQSFLFTFGFFFLVLLAAKDANAFQESKNKAFEDAAAWVLKNRTSKNPVPKTVSNFENLSKTEAEVARKKLWKSLQKLAKKNSNGKVLPKPASSKSKRFQKNELPVLDKKMPYVWMDREAPKNNRPMFIALHGGGRMNVKKPHQSPFNNREWSTQVSFARGLYPAGSMYFVPRMADDRDGRWYYNYCQDAYRKVIEDAVLRHNVDPNRVYLIGISEGAYTAYRLGAFMADRWAGSGSMAGGEPPRNAPPVNMRNLAFRADIGEKDTMFDRIGLNVRYGKELEKLQKEDPKGYQHHIQVHKGRGHGIDYRPCPNWLIKHKRNPWPKRVRWENINVHGRRKSQFYWIGIPQEFLGSLQKERKNTRFLIDAKISSKKNSISIDVLRKTKNGEIADPSVPLTVYLNDNLLNLDEPITVFRNGKQIFQGKIQRSLTNLVHSMAERRDPYFSFPAKLELPAEK